MWLSLSRPRVHRQFRRTRTLRLLEAIRILDGIDALAASEAVFVACAGALLILMCGRSNGVPAAGLILGAASLGFLPWNWPPAKIFMGDVGSGYIGYFSASWP